MRASRAYRGTGDEERPTVLPAVPGVPECFFEAVGRPTDVAHRYVLDSVEYKSAAVRLDGIFRPLDPAAGPAYLWEAQFHTSDRVYANLLAKIGLFLQNDGPAQDWVAVVLYPSRGTEQKNLHPYRCLIESDQLIRVYLDELPAARPDQFGLGILELIAAKPETALARVRALIPRVRASNYPEDFRARLLEFIETVIVYQFPNWSRTEVEKMIQVTDASQTRLFQEGREEGREEGRTETAEAIARRLLDMDHPVAAVAKATKLTVAQVHKLGKKPSK